MNSLDQWVVSSPKRTLLSGCIETWNSRPILFALLKRDLKSRYRASFMGFAWAFARPLMQLAVYTLVIGEILGASRSIENFAIYLFVGLMFWNFFAESIQTGTFSIISGAGLVTKIAFPREILPISAVLNAGVNLIIQFPILAVGFVIFDVVPNFAQILYLVPILLALFFISLGSALTLSAFNVYARDVQPLSELLLMLFMYLCPVIYSWTFVADAINSRFENDMLFEVYKWNPLAQIISGIQDFFWNGTRTFTNGEIAQDFMGTSAGLLWIGSAMSFIFLTVAYKIFLRLEPNFAREL